MTKHKACELRWEVLFEMNRRGDDRIEMELPCSLLFPNVWPGSLVGLTANLHRSGMIVACNVKPGRELPALGETANVEIQLPPNDYFPPKLMRCETRLIRIEQVGGQDFQFAMQITNVDFEDACSAVQKLMEMDLESCGYLM